MLHSGPGHGLGILLFVFTLKHFLCDFVFQTSAMARGKAAATGWLAPLLTHAAIHAGGTLALALAIAPRLWWLAVADFLVHAAIDRAKSLVSLKTRWTYDDAPFWWLFGFDQFLHQATNIALACALAAA